MNKYKISLIISGGQTGADRGGLDFAIKKSIPHGGWCPKNRLAEDGCIPSKYLLLESTTQQYPPRTRMNIRDSDATLIFSNNVNSKGTLLTTKFCLQLNKPYFIYNLQQDILKKISTEDINAKALEVLKWLNNHKPNLLNIAGSRESHCKGLQIFVPRFLDIIIEKSDKKMEWPPKKPTTPNLLFLF